MVEGVKLELSSPRQRHTLLFTSFAGIHNIYSSRIIGSRNDVCTCFTDAVNVFPFVPPTSIFDSLLNWTIVCVRSRISWQRSRKLSRRMNKALFWRREKGQASKSGSKYCCTANTRIGVGKRRGKMDCQLMLDSD